MTVGDAGACASCGRAPGEAHFCPGCGARLSGPPPLPEERKTVTTLFCDLVAFTAMSEQADPEDVDACLRAFGSAGARGDRALRRLRGEVHRGRRGRGLRRPGRARGRPGARRALPRCACSRASRGCAGPTAALQARAGIMTGELLVTLGSDPARGDGHVAGDAVNTAQRLEASAPPGAVVVGDLTHRLTRQAISLRGAAAVVRPGQGAAAGALAGATPRRAGRPCRGLRPALAAGRPRQRARRSAAACCTACWTAASRR